VASKVAALATTARLISAGGSSSQFVAEYRVQLPSEERIKERLEAFGEATDDA
jgi:hypothetical protein